MEYYFLTIAQTKHQPQANRIEKVAVAPASAKVIEVIKQTGLDLDKWYCTVLDEVEYSLKINKIQQEAKVSKKTLKEEQLLFSESKLIKKLKKFQKQYNQKYNKDSKEKYDLKVSVLSIVAFASLMNKNL